MLMGATTHAARRGGGHRVSCNGKRNRRPVQRVRGGAACSLLSGEVYLRGGVLRDKVSMAMSRRAMA